MPKQTSSKSNTKHKDAPSVPSKQPRTKKKPAVEVQDRSQWRPSHINENSKINKASAIAEYHLKPTDLEGLDFEKTRTVVRIKGTDMIRPMYLYKERDVELRAWEKHGGPEGFENLLNTKREKWYQKHGTSSGKFFPQPRTYMPPTDPSLQPSVYVLKRPANLVAFDVHTPALLEMKQNMLREEKEWLWNILNEQYMDSQSDPFDTVTRNREKIITSAVGFTQRYDPRPTEDHPQSAAFAALNEVLDRAPVDDGYNSEGKGLDVSIYYPEGDRTVDWDGAYYNEVYEALIKVIEEHGVDGWKMARWLVYDKYTKCNIGGIYFFMDDRRFSSTYGKYVWEDSCAFWLDPEDILHKKCPRMNVSEPRNRYYTLLSTVLGSGENAAGDL